VSTHYVDHLQYITNILSDSEKDNMVHLIPLQAKQNKNCGEYIINVNVQTAESKEVA